MKFQKWDTTGAISENAPVVSHLWKYKYSFENEISKWDTTGAISENAPVVSRPWKQKMWRTHPNGQKNREHEPKGPNASTATQLEYKSLDKQIKYPNP